MKKKMKLWVKLTIIFSSIILGLGAILGCAIAYFRLSVNSYYKASQYAFEIPEISSGYIPQGLCYSEAEQLFLLSGYMGDKRPSPVYVVNKSGEYQKKVTLLKSDGKEYTGHGGGIAVWQNFVYVTDGSSLLVYSFQHLLSAKNGDKLSCLGSISFAKSEQDYLGLAFVNVTGDTLITGEYYKEGNYPTLESHKLTTPAGDYNQAIALEYKLSSSFELGLSPTPTCAYSITDKVQGLTTKGSKIYLSTSWGISFSTILEYELSNLKAQGTIDILGHATPIYALDSDNLINTYKIAPMSEEIVFVDELLYVNCESASNKYIFGKLTGAKYLHKTDLSLM